MERQHARPAALVTGASRKRGIAAAIALAAEGWDVATTYWRPYDAAMPWGSAEEGVGALDRDHCALGAATAAIGADLAEVAAPARVFAAEAALGPVVALILAHCHSVDSGRPDTTVESFDRLFAVNARASWLLIREFGRRFPGEAAGRGRIVAITSDHVAGNLPYGASKGALDRIALAAARARGAADHRQRDQPRRDRHRLDGRRAAGGDRGAHAAGPRGPAARLRESGPLPLLGAGGWINGQLLFSNGGAA